tara:strand:+ start:280 stop:1161 length:882 start_codon:yes stop_codon:yes gene_type:complete
MGLKDLKSNLDIHGGNQAISQGGSPSGILSNPNPPYDGGAFQAQGPDVGVENYDHDFHREGEGTTDSPFKYKSKQGASYPNTDDHMVALLERRNVSSTNTDPLGPLGSSMHTNPMTYSPTPGGNGQGTLDDVPSPNNAQNGNGIFGDALNQGKTVGGEDLHIAMLKNNYTSDNTSANFGNGSSYGAGQPGATYPTLNPGGLRKGGELDLNTTTGGIGDAPGFAKYRNPHTNSSIEPSPNVLDTVSEQGLEGMYNSTVNPTVTYNSNWPKPGRQTPDLDINGGTPNKYQNNLPL